MASANREITSSVIGSRFFCCFDRNLLTACKIILIRNVLFPAARRQSDPDHALQTSWCLPVYSRMAELFLHAFMKQSHLVTACSIGQDIIIICDIHCFEHAVQFSAFQLDMFKNSVQRRSGCGLVLFDSIDCSLVVTVPQETFVSITFPHSVRAPKHGIISSHAILLSLSPPCFAATVLPQ